MRRFGLGVFCGVLLAGAGAAIAQVVATVDTDGVLQGYTVQKDGRDICRDPMVWNEFRGQGSFIVCP